MSQRRLAVWTAFVAELPVVNQSAGVAEPNLWYQGLGAVGDRDVRHSAMV
jgi:hypothetical protein